MRAHTRDKQRVCFRASQSPKQQTPTLTQPGWQERHRITSHIRAPLSPLSPPSFRLESEQLAFPLLINISCIPLCVFFRAWRYQHMCALASKTMQGDGRSDEEPYVPRSRLLQLPKELQLSIWEFALAEHDPIPFFTAGSSQIIDHSRSLNNIRLKWYIPPLLQTCRTCRIEGLPVFYGSNIFILQHEPIFDDYQHAHTLFRRYWQHLTLITDFGVEYKLPSSNTFLLRGQRRLVDNGYTTICDFTDAMIAFLAAFGEKMTKNELRVLRFCGDCGKKMVEQKPRRPRWEDLPPISMPMHSSLESMMSDE
jgi:hypothetical protein